MEGITQKNKREREPGRNWQWWLGNKGVGLARAILFIEKNQAPNPRIVTSALATIVVARTPLRHSPGFSVFKLAMLYG